MNVALSSLPTRERGLKWCMMQVNTSVTKSLPTRERGLKFDYIGIAACADNVAPYAGAWVEIRLYQFIRHNVPSLPTRERGLK